MAFQLSAPPRILAIHAHPDDIEILCAGTLALLKKRGCEIVMASMSPGDKGSAELGPDEIAAVRRKEGAKAASLLGVHYMCLEFRDLCIDVNDESRKKVTEALRKAQPDIVLTAPPVDYMGDHEATSRLVRDACFSAAVPNYYTEQWDPAPLTKKIPALYYMDPIEGVDWYGNPVPSDFVVDISETFETKLQMLACHASQRDWLKRQHGMDEYLDSCRRWSARRGAELGVAYGEGFRQHRGHPYPHDNVLLELLNG
ncbi:PIG-L deacetylase family protein [Planctomicrobium piriforme]|uniref:N-acetylglucosaminyl deacetylase, LmbE family n=1 Tax=Planctomicrobium piriforme TaxID=1576369 RepID=A0A1I3GMK6_9PLAN|nr:PIG-L family deacetylase [Planctomicrobium piriforme]SFI24492.1 N-acetylglucosaminyl deacetylase, LmbE family [Planctomicrobium piriforme]